MKKIKKISLGLLAALIINNVIQAGCCSSKPRNPDELSNITQEYIQQEGIRRQNRQKKRRRAAIQDAITQREQARQKRLEAREKAHHQEAISRLENTQLFSPRYSDFGRNALHLAAEKGNRREFDVLIAAVKIQASSQNIYNENDEIKRLLSEVDQHGQSPLHIAINFDQDLIAKKLMNHGVSVKTEDCLGMTPLHHAAKRSLNLTIFNMILEGIKRQAAKEHPHDIDAQKKFIKNVINTPDKNQRTALHMAVGEGSYQAAFDLISHGASIKATDNKGQSPLHIATNNGAIRIITLIMDTVINQAQNKNLTNTEIQAIIDTILEKETKDGQTPLSLAVKCKQSTLTLRLFRNWIRVSEGIR